MIFTTNKPLSEWGKVLHDADLAAAILDRVLERGRFIHLDGPSGRTRHRNLEQVSSSTAERLRISGINGSQFPEPTRGTRNHSCSGTIMLEERGFEMSEATKQRERTKAAKLHFSPFKAPIDCTKYDACKSLILNAKVAELADAPDLGSGG
jgi:hypothetical protein